MFETRELIAKDRGLLVLGSENSDYIYACTDGPILAHDVLEHMNEPQFLGEPWDELQALGAIHYLRSPWVVADIRFDIDTMLDSYSTDEVGPPVENPQYIDYDLPQQTPIHGQIPFTWLQHMQVGYQNAIRKYPNSLECHHKYLAISAVQIPNLPDGTIVTLSYNQERAFIS